MQVEVLERVNTAVAACVTREQIMGLQDAMFAKLQEMGLPHTPGNTDELCPVTHHHAPGLYAREIFIPAGVLIVGKIHKHSHVNTISKGRVIVATEFGTQELVAPVTFVSVPGTKRAVVAQEDTIWTTYHPTEETDLAKIEEEVIAPDFLAYEQWRLS
jgi:quercetin dioxygenase-like cupin family protein